MPTYQYSCTECGEALEVQQSFSDDPLTTCPVCQGRLRKVYNAVGVVFKGSGFYRTDSRAGGSGAKDATTSSSSESSTPSSSSSSDSSSSSGTTKSGPTKSGPTKSGAASSAS